MQSESNEEPEQFNTVGDYDLDENSLQIQEESSASSLAVSMVMVVAALFSF